MALLYFKAHSHRYTQSTSYTQITVTQSVHIDHKAYTQITYVHYYQQLAHKATHRAQSRRNIHIANHTPRWHKLLHNTHAVRHRDWRRVAENPISNLERNRQPSTFPPSCCPKQLNAPIPGTLFPMYGEISNKLIYLLTIWTLTRYDVSSWCSKNRLCTTNSIHCIYLVCIRHVSSWCA